MSLYRNIHKRRKSGKRMRKHGEKAQQILRLLHELLKNVVVRRVRGKNEQRQIA